MAYGDPDFELFRLPDEHEQLRAAVRDLVTDKVAPRAAEIDRTGEFPYDVHDALARSGFNAIHIPEAYGGAGGDSIAAVLVIEEVSRACASSGLIPALNKLGTMPLLLEASEELKQFVLPPIAAGDAMCSYALS
jgi:alkylation response protein AidB-like acyl-CoA dehydrogenase